jgi:catechol 2,3-dioxygenase-like lactoylglutathione lyase family enzyme
MIAPISRLDHVIIGVKDLAAAARTYERLGFRLTPRGLHEGKGTGNHCIMFANAYIELLGIVDQTEADRSMSRLSKLVSERGEGGIGLAYGGNDADEIARKLRQAGIDAEEPNDLARPLDLDGERHMVRFRNVMLPNSQPPGLIQFVCTHLTPELTRARHEWEFHVNGVVGLSGVWTLVDDIAPVAASWERLFGGDRIAHSPSGPIVPLHGATPATTERAAIALTANTPASLAVAVGASLLKGLPKPPAISALGFTVNEPDVVTTILDASGVPYEEEDGVVFVHPTSANGVLLIFEGD